MTLYKVAEQVDVTKFYNKDKCQLYELVQYQCEANKTNIECSPFVRLFLKCEGVPTVEVTPEYNEDGEVMNSFKEERNDNKGDRGCDGDSRNDHNNS